MPGSALTWAKRSRHRLRMGRGRRLRRPPVPPRCRNRCSSSPSGETAKRLTARSSGPTMIRSTLIDLSRLSETIAPGDSRGHDADMADVEAVEPVARQASYGQVFAVGSFRALFGGTVLTIVATSLQMLGLSVLVYLATGSAWLSAVAFGAGFLPQVLGG